MTRLSWNEVRTRAANFAREWKDAAYEKEETQSFYNEFFEIFGVQRRSVARYEQHVAKLDNRHGFIDLFWPGVLLVEQKSAGRDLAKAYDQAGEYFDALEERDRPQYILVSDFQTFELHDLDERQRTVFRLAELPKHVEAFGFILGVQRRPFRDQDPANIEAAELVGRIHDALHAAHYRGHDLERFLVRIVFCLFADDTGIFEPRDLFLDFIEARTSADGADLGPWLAQLFQILDTEENSRSPGLDEDLARFPYVDGDLFKGALSIPSFDGGMRQTLLDACRFDWTEISPAIFGALFQSVMEPTERRAQGAHYTTEKNILKVIEPLLLDDLRDELERLRARKDRGRHTALLRFQEKLSTIRLLDPACGCGNFLIIAYRELRTLEMETIRNIKGFPLPRVNVDQFFGIEISEFPVRIAETAMWMMDHIMNNRFSLELGETFTRIPLEKSPHIVQADALKTNWEELLPAEDCTAVLGNPPFVGAKFQTREQRLEVGQITGTGTRGSTLDYVTAWFVKAANYVKANPSTRIGFVATNSITQGDHVGQLWPVLFNRCLEIAFAHRTFAWGSDARGKAHVHVVILGLDHRKNARDEKRLFSYPDIDGEPEESCHGALSPYLFDAAGLADPHLTVQREHEPINTMRKLAVGSNPLDGGHYVFSDEARDAFLDAEPKAAPFMRPYVGAREYLRGKRRWVLALQDASPRALARLPLVRERIAAVRAYREESKSAFTRSLADTPRLYHLNVLPDAPFLAIPQTSSERREYVPIGWLEPPVIPSVKLILLENATLADFALLTSAMHMSWMRTVTGRMKSDYSYSIGLVYNAFPLPPKDSDFSTLEPVAQAVLDARAEHEDVSLADLYDPELMPAALRRAHQKLDRTVDRLYRRARFTSEPERIVHLMALYEKMGAPLHADMLPKAKRARRRRAPKRRAK